MFLSITIQRNGEWVIKASLNYNSEKRRGSDEQPNKLYGIEKRLFGNNFFYCTIVKSSAKQILFLITGFKRESVK